MVKEGDPFDVHPAAKRAMDLAFGAMDQYFEFLKKTFRLSQRAGRI
jgi:hypothetical protein